MYISSFNVNSINARINNLIDYLNNHPIDVILLQEIKSVEENFPYKTFKDLGYNIYANCQKSYNGVAVLSKFEMTNPKFSFFEDTQARFLEVDILDYKIICIYVPNGNPVNTEKYTYKLNWLENFYSYCKSLVKTNKKIVIGGDFNIIQSNLDCYNEDDWTDDALFTIEVKKKLRQILHLGFHDSFRAKNSSKKGFSYWDYQSGAWQKDNGIRIDDLLLSPEAANNLIDCQVDRNPRSLVKPSDHTPIWCDLSI